MPAIKVKVETRHITSAVKADASHCPIAQAIKEKFPKARWVMVDLQSIRWTDRSEGVRYKYLTPLPAQKALLKFDSGHDLDSFIVALGHPIVTPIHRVVRKKAKKVTVKKTKRPDTRKYKHKKAVPEASAKRTHGLRNI
jgi:hypothetical protein